MEAGLFVLARQYRKERRGSQRRKEEYFSSENLRELCG
jgi:hypothetical protein